MSDTELLERIRAAINHLAPAVKKHPDINGVLNKLAKLEAEVRHGKK